MSKIWASLGGNTGAVIAGGGMAAALLLGAYIAFGRSGDGPVVSTVSAPQPDAPVQTVEPKQETASAQVPSFDEVRREPDGTTIIAGRAEPMSDVKILLDGAEVATAKADSTGGFAAIAMLPPKQSAQIVSLSAQAEEQKAVTPSLDEIILAPSKTTSTSDETAPKVQIAEEGTKTEEPVQPEVVTAAPEQTKPAEVAVLKSDAEGVSLLSAAAPQAMTSVALDTIGYSEAGDVQLTGRAQPDTTKVRVYLDNRSVVSLPVDEHGRWRGDLPDVDEGVYTLRVDEVSAQGAVSSRVETPFKRESAEILAQAAASADGPIKSITVQAGATLWAIARDRYGDGTLYVRVFEANVGSIRNPDLIYPGQVFDLPN
ncbi:LysM peptidoglycan-binding domain-containing protein [Sulfitobacter sp. S223]|uniref:LysM peptidoglycan-binding domain-containing protein n=1 Tax=Sulfitobacter sp. S223 TaxID=2867023 RepID=UPI0021A27991|nr:LysM peptidoglycan-binding domain-containing protein [Sulfitobacter sp. S223]UWR25148.1 LysM peptidoglycan-binding domain-containing protein [Sulfitobacter sp. S223]